MTLSQKQLADCCPAEVAEYIDQVVLPDHADGYHNASQICADWRDEAMDRLIHAIKDSESYQKQRADLSLIDAWISWGPNAVIAKAYIQEAFDSWVVVY